MKIILKYYFILFLCSEFGYAMYWYQEKPLTLSLKEISYGE
ncbi:hypothetical protein M2132_001223 [Dysgonomonas sp. PH5-45]|nr:hypothetical protein [Dysgonomonas sp. PH5-45]MDH6387789.1 hypothetical protein [Dysgonomonas sp. PH5-37]